MKRSAEWLRLTWHKDQRQNDKYRKTQTQKDTNTESHEPLAKPVAGQLAAQPTLGRGPRRLPRLQHPPPLWHPPKFRPNPDFSSEISGYVMLEGFTLLLHLPPFHSAPTKILTYFKLLFRCPSSSIDTSFCICISSRKRTTTSKNIIITSRNSP